MRRGGGRTCYGVGRVGISLLILSLFHVPLPKPDFHNVRHHDAPGQVCEYHDHLLRWHPDATAAQDVALFHWHWFLLSDSADMDGPGDGAAIHAHVTGWDAPSIDVGPPVVTQGPGRPHDAIVPNFQTLLAILPLDFGRIGIIRPGPFPIHAFSATFAPQTSLSCLLQRWSC